ncbi:MAG: helix-turn-helix domain-containing protein [Chloroflexota bacterium]
MPEMMTETMREPLRQRAENRAEADTGIPTQRKELPPAPPETPVFPTGPGADVAGETARATYEAAVEALRTHDPYYARDLPGHVVGHGPAHPAGQAARAIGREVRTWRTARGVTQAELAERLHMSQPNVARLETGAITPTLSMLWRLARVTGMAFHLAVTPGGIAIEPTTAGEAA